MANSPSTTSSRSSSDASSRNRVRDASAVILVRGAAPKLELYWVRRSREVALGGGFHAFPGGRVDDADATLATALQSRRSREGREPDALDPFDAALRVAACRELFEEVGVLLASGPFDRAALEVQRRELLDGRTDFATILDALDAQLELDSLQPAGRWLTPPYAPVRFDARFFLATLPEGQDTEVWPGELVDGEWITPSEGLSRWRAGRALLHPPASHALHCLESEAPPDCLQALCNPPYVTEYVAERIDFQAGIFVVPLLTPTLPPATHTNCYVVGEDELVVIDPASPRPEEQARLAAFCRQLREEGRRFREILLTHEHHDHVGGVDALRAELGVPVRAHPATLERLRGKVHVDAAIDGDELIELPGLLGLRLRAVFTPGHARGHLCFFEETTGALITGDMVAGIGSIVVDPPEGDMSDYVASLRALRALPVRTIYPAHGPAIPDGPAKLDEYLAHRAERERQVYDALIAVEEGSAINLVPRVYADVPEALHPLAARSLTAILDKLVKDGRVTVDTDGQYRPL